MKNRLIVTISVLIVAALIPFFNGTNNIQNTEIKNNKLNVENLMNEDEINYARPIVDLLVDIGDPKVMSDISDYIVVARIDSILGSDNYSKVHGMYVFPYTYGNMTILKVFKGNIKENSSVKFYRGGGTITFKQYYNGLSESEKEKYNSVNKGKFPEYKYIDYRYMGDIEIESSKIYLAYLKQEEGINNEDNSYTITGLQGGLREVKEYKNNLNIDDIEVLNNFTNEYEKLKNIIEE